MKVLITGSSGQIGTNVGLALMERGEYEAARQQVENALRVDETNAEATALWLQISEILGEPTYENLEEALLLGRQVYVGEGCWHCHSQFIRPVSNESRRWGGP